MTKEECNKIIAEFIYPENKLVKLATKESCFEHDIAPDYTQSLDALVPVWEKLEIDYKYESFRDSPIGTFWEFTICLKFNPIRPIELTETRKSLQEAAAQATAKAILVLKELK